ncbi:MAG: chemotaxis protein CheB [Gallionellaceae bacterium]|jgi:two-component system CheB/CheR fusion protein
MTTPKVSKILKQKSNVAENNPTEPNETLLPENIPDKAFPVVGVGASAGGLAAFEAFFSGMPTDSDPGMAFVLVQHLAPDHKSILADLIRRYTRMQVFEVEDGMPVQINCAYIIPPNYDMAFINGTLQLLEPSAPRGQRLPIDFLFRSLAQDQHERAIGIVLSGTGSDGTLGIRAIKGEGGMVMAQTLDSAEFDGMPHSAVATGMVDFQLPPSEMAAKLIAYSAHAFRCAKLPDTLIAHKTEIALKKVFVLLRAQTGHDFSLYKPSTIHRRIERRMAVQQVEALDDYVKFLQQTPAEVEELFHDFLIGVTSFFRDPDAFQVLESQLIPLLFNGKNSASILRVWVTGCSTGEEAYSIAILLQEYMEKFKQSYTVQLFATDIDSRAIATARAGIYPASIAADISPQRLARYFISGPTPGTYRIHKNIRDMLVFSEQDLIKDPPFSKIDLICCRNLLIYFGTELQKKIIPLFHFSLNPNGMLFLGTSEGVGEFSELFAPMDRKAKLYKRKENFLGSQRSALGQFLPPITAVNAARKRDDNAAIPSKMPLRELAEQALLRQIAPASALVNAKGDILYLHGRTGMFLEPAPGEAGINNIIKMAREGLRRDLSVGLHKAVVSKDIVRVPNLRVKTNAHYTLVDLGIHPVTSIPAVISETPLYLVVLEEVISSEINHLHSVSPDSGDSIDARIEALQQELRAKDEYIQSNHEEMESSNEELKSANEEMQSVNEELQSTNEELETTKEEIQSTNEELATVNAELNIKVLDLARVNNDMNNLLAGTGIATVFVDHQQRILRFTPAASAITNMILTDVGRPVSHIASNLVSYDRLEVDTQAVLDTLVPKELEVQIKQGKWYLMRIQPYRTLDNIIEGAVISFVDITEIVQAREALQKVNEIKRLSVLMRDASDAIIVQDLSGKTTAWNPYATQVYGWSEAEALNMNLLERIPTDRRKGELATLQALIQANTLQPHQTQRLNKDGKVLDICLTATALLDENGQIYAIATLERVG